jgi:hypothetical protein
VLQGLLHGDTAGWVELEHLDTEIQGNLVEVFEVGLRIDSFELGEGRFEVGQII